MVAYADTGFIFSLYAQDVNTPRAGEVADALGAPLVLTPPRKHELRNAFRLAVFRGHIGVEKCRSLLVTVEGDITTGALVKTPVARAEVHAQAEALSAAHTGGLGTRASDVLHVASAAALGATEF